MSAPNERLFNIVPVDPGSELMYAVSELVIADLNEEGVHNDAPDDVVRGHASVAGTSGETYYAVLDPKGKLMAAASAVHGWQPGNTRVFELVVRYDKRGRGIGRALVEHLAREADAHGDDIISLLPWSEGFYGSMGFSRSGGSYREIQIDVARLLPRMLATA